MDLEQKEEALDRLLAGFGSALVAFSGGVDSSYLAFRAHQVLGDQAWAVTALSPSVSEFQREQARTFAQRFGLRHRFIHTAETERSEYRQNPSNRCYFCKSELYGRLEEVRRQEGLAVILDGTNQDDTRDFRPGRQAGREWGVRSPLAEVGISKEEIRALSRKWGLPTWNQPAMPCLASRFPYGVAIDPQKLRQVELAEAFLRTLGLRTFRVRHHQDLARIEVAREEMSLLLDLKRMQEVDRYFRSLGYRHVTLDLRGFRSGSLNEALPEGPSPAGETP